MKYLARVLPLLAVIAFAACGGDSFSGQCKDSCSEADCDGTKLSDSEKSSCENLCTQLDTFNDVSGCKDEADDGADKCADNDACSEDNTVSDDCRAASAAYSSCVSAYCSANSSNSFCSQQ